MKILLDTCAFLWIVTDSEKLSKTAASIFLDRANECYLSAASAWEIAIKYSLTRLPLPERPHIFVPAARDASGIGPLMIDEESALHAGRLPKLHSDPFDRIVVAQAIVHGMAILTPDPLLEQYAVRVLW